MADETRRVLPNEVENIDASRTRRVDEEATRRVSTELLSTRLAGEQTTAGARLPLGAMAPGQFLCGEYQIHRIIQPHETTRPGLYLCQGPEGSVIVKVAALQFPPKLELWHRLPWLRHPNILRTFRTIELDGLYYEIQEFCDCGTLEERVPRPGSGFPPVTAEWIIKQMIPQVHGALKYLHEQEIIHRDIKPANIYIKAENGNEVLVVGDFDISSVLEQTRTSRDTQRAAGTWLYTAPEAFPRFVDDHAGSRKGRITRSSDYYALAITIIEMILGTTSLHLCQLPDLFDFYLQGGRVEIPQGIHGRLATLLRGLLIRNRHTRWGAAEIERWLADANTDEDLKHITDDDYFELARASRPYRLKDRSAVDLPGLAEAMFREQEIATEDLMTGEVLLTWIGALDPAVARELHRDRDRLYMHPSMYLHCAVMRCDPTRPFIFFDNTEVNTPDEWITHALQLVNQRRVSMENLATEELLQQLEVWLRLKTDPQHSLADAVAEIQNSPQRVRLEELAYLFQPERPFVIMRGYSAATPKDFVLIAYGKPEEWRTKCPSIYKTAYHRWEEGGLCAWLRQRGLTGLAAQSDEIREQLADDPYAAFETVLRLLHPALPLVPVEFDTAEIPPECLVTYSKQRTCNLRYTAKGPGMPFGALVLRGDTTGIRLSERLIRAREGIIALVFEPGQDIPCEKHCQLQMEFISGVARPEKAGPLKINYRVIYPLENTLLRILAGAGIGALILGLPRLLLALYRYWQPLTWQNGNLDTLWDGSWNWQFPQLDLVCALVVLLIFVYLALRFWLQALRKSVR